MNKQWAFEITELPFESPITSSLTRHHYRVTFRTSSGLRLSGITIRTNRSGHFALHIPPTLLIKPSLGAPLATLQFTALDHAILHGRLTQIHTANTPPLHHSIATRSPPS